MSWCWCWRCYWFCCVAVVLIVAFVASNVAVCGVASAAVISVVAAVVAVTATAIDASNSSNCCFYWCCCWSSCFCWCRCCCCSSTAHLFHGRSKGPPLIFLRQLFLISLALCWVSRKAEGSKAGRWADWQTGLALLRLVTTTLDLKKRTDILKLETAQLQTF